MIITYAVIFFTFFILDCTSLSLGDDLGYMFADSALHKGDGERIRTIADCFSTQCSHYMTTNGRFVVHLVVQMLIALLPRLVFILLNSLVFTILVRGIVNISFSGETGEKPVWQYACLTASLLWLLMPDPGLIMLSLRAFTVNYMWTAAAIVWWFVGFRKVLEFGRSSYVAFVIISLLCGSLQESYSLPVSGALLLMLFAGGKQWRNSRTVWTTIMFWIGTAVCVFAPANFVRLSSGSEQAASGLMRNIELTLECTLHSPLIWLILFLLIVSISRQLSLRVFFKDNKPLFFALVLSLLMNLAVFNATRQFWPVSIFSLVLLLKAIRLTFSGFKLINRGLCVIVPLTVIILSGSMFLRLRTYTLHQSLLSNIARNRASDNIKVWVEGEECNYNKYSLMADALSAYSPEPFARRGLYCTFDPITGRGLSRLLCEKDGAIKAVLPYPPQYFRNRFEGETSADTVCMKRLDAVYSVLRVPSDYKCGKLRVRSKKGKAHYLKYVVADTDSQYRYLLVLPLKEDEVLEAPV